MTSLLAVVKAEYSYDAQTADELTIKEDDLLYVLEDEDSEWWKVRVKTAPDEDASSAASGLVPATYVAPLPSLAAVTSLYAYEPQNDEELEVAEDEQLVLYERDGDWVLVGRGDGQKGVGYIPSTWIEEAGAEVNGAVEEAREPSPEPVVAAAAPPKRDFLPPPTRTASANAARPNAEARNVQTWNVTEVDAKKKKKKGTLGVGNGALFFASESDKTPVQQYSLSELTSHRTEKDKHLYLVFAELELHFSISSKTELNEILAKLDETGSSAPAPRPLAPSPPPVASTSAIEYDQPHINGDSNDAYATVLYEFTGEAEDELSVADGERVIVVDSSADDWWKVRRTDGSGEEGVVPASYVELEGGDAAGGEDAAAAEQARIEAEEEERRAREEERSAAETAAAATAAAAARKRAKEEAAKREEARQRSTEAKRAAQPPPLAKRPSTRDSDKADESASRPGGGSSGKREEAKKPAGKTRIWRDRTGQFKVEAEFLGIQNGKVRLHKMNGVVIAVPLSKMSPEDTEYLQRLERRSGQIDDDDSPLSTRSRQPSGGQRRPSASDSKARERTAPAKKPEVDWFEFFLNAGCDIDDCTRYARNFDKDRIDESVLDDLEPSTLRSLGLREGDVIRVIKHIKAKHAPRELGPDAARAEQMRKDEELARELHERETGERLPPPSRDGSGLFTNASGGLKSTRRGRPQGGKTAPDKVSADALSVQTDVSRRDAATPPISASPASSATMNRQRSSSTVPVASGFDDDAWTNRPASKPSTPAPAPAAPSPPPLPSKPADPPRAASTTPSSASVAHDLNESILAQLGISNRPPSAPVNRTQASGPSFPQQSQASQASPANGARGPLAPVVGNAPLLNPLVPTQTGNLGFVPTRPGGISSPVVPQMTGFSMAPQATGYQPQMMPQPTGYMQQQQAPMMPAATGFQPQPAFHHQQSFQNQQQPSYQQPQQQPNFQHQQSFGQSSYSQPSFSSGISAQPTGWNGASAMQMQPTGYSPSPQPPAQQQQQAQQQQMQQPQQQSSAPTRFDPTNVFGSMKSGTFGKDANAQPQAEEKYNALRPQMTGFAPGGVVSGGLVAQPTGVFANWQSNPMAQQQTGQQQGFGQQGGYGQQQQQYQRYY